MHARTGADRFAEAKQWWADHVRTAVVRDEVHEPGSGVVCFGSFAFADDPGDSTLVVPEVVLGRRAGTTWLTTIGDGSIPAPFDVARRRAAECTAGRDGSPTAR